MSNNNFIRLIHSLSMLNWKGSRQEGHALKPDSWVDEPAPKNCCDPRLGWKGSALNWSLNPKGKIPHPHDLNPCWLLLSPLFNIKLIIKSKKKKPTSTRLKSLLIIIGASLSTLNWSLNPERKKPHPRDLNPCWLFLSPFHWPQPPLPLPPLHLITIVVLSMKLAMLLTKKSHAGIGLMQKWLLFFFCQK